MILQIFIAVVVAALTAAIGEEWRADRERRLMWRRFRRVQAGSKLGTKRAILKRLEKSNWGNDQ